jgi:4-aminobutyrate aminotransferase-like enzyme
VIRLLPPLVMPEHLLEQGLDIIDQAFDEVTRNPTSGDV